MAASCSHVAWCCVTAALASSLCSFSFARTSASACSSDSASVGSQQLTGLDGTERSSWETAKAVFVAAAEDCGCSGAARAGPGLLVLLLAAVAAGWQG